MCWLWVLSWVLLSVHNLLPPQDTVPPDGAMPNVWMQTITRNQTSGNGLRPGLRQEALCVCITLSMGVHTRKHYCLVEVPQNAKALPSNHQKRAAVHTGSPHLSPVPRRLLFSTQLHVPPHLFSLRSLAQPFSSTTLQAVVVLMRYWQLLAEKSAGTPKHGKFPNSPFFIAGGLAQRLLSRCWLTR